MDKHQHVSVSCQNLVGNQYNGLLLQFSHCIAIIIIINSSVHTAIECLLLPTFTNGMISYSPDISPNFDLGTDATYTCDAGFFLDVTAASQVRTCIDDNGMDAIGVWSGQEPSCIRKLSIMNFLEYSCRYFMYRIIAGNFR